MVYQERTTFNIVITFEQTFRLEIKHAQCNKTLTAFLVISLLIKNFFAKADILIIM